MDFAYATFSDRFSLYPKDWQLPANLKLPDLDKFTFPSHIFGMTEVAIIAAAAGAVAAIFGTLYYLQLTKKNKRGRQTMTRRQQRQAEKQAIADMITDVLEDALYRGKIERDRVNYWYRRLCRSAGLWDLIPKDRLLKHPDPNELKAELRKKHKTKSNVIQLETKRQPKNALEASMMRSRKKA